MFRPVPDPTLWEKNAFELFQSADPDPTKTHPDPNPQPRFLTSNWKLVKFDMT